MCVSTVGTVGTTLPRSVSGVRPMKTQGRGVSDPAGDVRRDFPFPLWADILFAFG